VTMSQTIALFSADESLQKSPDLRFIALVLCLEGFVYREALRMRSYAVTVIFHVGMVFYAFFFRRKGV